MLNREMFRATATPICEYEPAMKREAFLSDPYHGLATIELLTAAGKQTMRVCADCAEKHFLMRNQRRFLRAGGKPVY